MLTFKIFENINWNQIKKYGFDIFPKDIFTKLENLKEENLIVDWHFFENDSDKYYDEDTQEYIESYKIPMLCIETKLSNITKMCDLEEVPFIYKLIDNIKNRININEDQFISLPEVKKFIDLGFDVEFDKGYIMLKRVRKNITDVFSFELTLEKDDVFLTAKVPRGKSKSILIELSPIKEMQIILHRWLDQYDYMLEK